MRYLIIVSLLILSFSLAAQIGMNMNTPEGSVSMQVTGPMSNGTIDSDLIVDQIAEKLEKLEKEVHIKLNKIDQKKAQKIMDEIYALLAMLPEHQPSAVAPAAPTAATSAAASSSSASSSSSSSSGTVNINMNISGMDESVKPKPKPHHDNDNDEHQPKPTTSSRKVMPETEFATLMGRISKESFSDDKLRVLRTAAKNFRFNCNQIIRLIGAYTYSEDKLEALRISYPEVSDPQNNYKILDTFTYSSDKDEAETIMNY